MILPPTTAQPAYMLNGFSQTGARQKGLDFCESPFPSFH